MSEEIETKNARIRSTMLGFEDHGLLTCMIDLDYGDGGQGFGGYGFDEPVFEGGAKDIDHGKFLGRRGHAYGMEFIRRVLEVLDVDRWEKLPGTFCRVRAEWGKVHAIGHPLKDVWFSPADLATEMGRT